LTTGLGNGALTNFLKERDNPQNTNDYIHTKFMLVDPLSDDPLVVRGSANFSPPLPAHQQREHARDSRQHARR